MALSSTVRERLAGDRLIWLTTVSPSGQPHSSLVWYVPDGEDELIIYSLDSLRVRNIGDGQKVALNLNSDELGGSVTTFTGEARIDPDLPPCHELPAYVGKYRDWIEGYLGMTVEAFAERYSVPLRVKLTGVRSW